MTSPQGVFKESLDASVQDGTTFYERLSQKTTRKVYASLFDYLQDETKKMELKTSFYTLDFGDLLWKIQLWKKNMPGVQPFFAVKTNSDPALLRFLTIMGFSFDCASESELQMVREAGADPGHAIFAQPVKIPGALKYAKEIGVDLMTFDSEEELIKIQKYYPSARLLLRLIPEDVKCTYDLSVKFGCRPDDASKVLTRAKDLNLNVKGVSFHVGGLCKNCQSYATTIRTSRTVFDEAQKLGFEFKILDIGAGFLGARGTEDIFNEITGEIRIALKTNFPEKGIQVIAEPGTYFAESAGNLVTGIIGKKKIADRYKKTYGAQMFYYLNESIYSSFSSGIIEQYGANFVPLLVESELAKRQVFKSKLWGQSCCGSDEIVKECSMPEMEAEEYLVWHNMGAYTQVHCSPFCGAPTPPHKYIFINNARLTIGNFSNVEEITEYINSLCTLIDKE